MKKTSLKILICLFAVLMLGTVLVACNKNTDVKPDFYVTFDYNEGNVGYITNEAIKEQYLGVMTGNLVQIRPGFNDQFEETAISGYYVEDWYTAKLDENGNPKKDENGIVELDKKWDFKNQRVYEDITLYANLQKQAVMYFIDIETGEKADTTIMAKPGTRRNRPSAQGAPKKEKYTFRGIYYTDETRTTEFTWPYIFDSNDVNVYVDFIAGENLSFVETADDFISAFNTSRNIYLLNDIDLEGKASALLSGMFYNGEFNGRGFTVSGINQELTARKTDYENKGGIFGTLGSDAYIHDVKFENVTVTYSLGLNVPVGISVGFFAWKAEEGARIENVTVSGSMTYASNNGGVTASEWIANDSTRDEDVIGCIYSVELIKAVEE